MYENDVGTCFDDCKPTREGDWNVPGYESQEEGNRPEPKKKTKTWDKAKRGAWKTVKWATFPAWAVPYLMVKSSKFRTTALISTGMMMLMGPCGLQEAFIKWGLWSLLAIGIGQWAVQKYVFSPPKI